MGNNSPVFFSGAGLFRAGGRGVGGGGEGEWTATFGSASTERREEALVANYRTRLFVFHSPSFQVSHKLDGRVTVGGGGGRGILFRFVFRDNNSLHGLILFSVSQSMGQQCVCVCVCVLCVCVCVCVCLCVCVCVCLCVFLGGLLNSSQQDQGTAIRIIMPVVEGICSANPQYKDQKKSTRETKTAEVFF